MSAVYFAPTVNEQSFEITDEKQCLDLFHSKWSMWYEESCDNGNEQIKFLIHHEGPYLFANKFRLTLECDKINEFSNAEEVIMMDNLDDSQVVTFDLPRSSVRYVYGRLCMLDAGCITSNSNDHLQVYHDFSNSDRPHDVVLNFSDGKLYCNKIVLALCFNYFDRLFFSETDSKNMKTCDLPELRSRVVEHLLNICFSNQKEFPQKAEDLAVSWSVSELKTVCFLEMSAIVDILKEHATIDIGYPLFGRKKCFLTSYDFKNLMMALELAEKHNLPHVQTAAVNWFRENFDSEKKNKFVAEYENRLKQLKLKNLFNFLERGFDVDNKKPECTFALSVDEEAEIYEKKVNNFKNVTLLIGDRGFKVHKEYLAFWSPYFDRLFFGDFAEKGKSEIELKEIDPGEFAILLKMIYPPRNVKIDDTNVIFLLKLADRLDMKDIMILCGNYLAESVQNNKSTIDLMDLLEIADAYRLIDVQVVCFHKIKQMNSNESEKFRRENRVRLGKLSPRMITNIVQVI